MDKVLTQQINARRLWHNIEEMARFSEAHNPWTRTAFSDLYLQGREWLRQRFLAAGADHVGFDAAANLIARWGEPSKPSVLIGSHTDTVRSGGRFSGVVGVMAALEVAESIAEWGIELPYSLEVVDFFNEEPNRYGFSCVGSSAMAGSFPQKWLTEHDANDVPLAEALKKMGARPDLWQGPLRSPPAYYLECHIEQGPVLEHRGVDIGIVTTITGATQTRLVMRGQSNHAGNTPMNLRRDALLMAGEFHRRLNQEAAKLNSEDNYLVATVGSFQLRPNASNIIPGEVEMVVDVRCNNRSLQLEFDAWLRQIAGECVRQLGGALAGWEILADHSPVTCDSYLQERLAHACDLEGYSFQHLVSAAGHGCRPLSSFCPSALVLIPSRGGISNSPQEWSSAKQIAKGCQLLARTLLLLKN